MSAFAIVDLHKYLRIVATTEPQVRTRLSRAFLGTRTGC